ncbi:hypothetical protein GCM10022275_01630 [Tessaracoccus defluvii]
MQVSPGAIASPRHTVVGLIHVATATAATTTPTATKAQSPTRFFTRPRYRARPGSPNNIHR